MSHTPTPVQALHYEMSRLADFCANVLDVLESHDPYTLRTAYDDAQSLGDLARKALGALVQHIEAEKAAEVDSDPFAPLWASADAALAQYMASEASPVD